MSTLRINNIEAQSIPANPTLDEKVKVTNSSGDILVNIDGKTSGITTIGINTTDGNIKFDANSNVLITGILTATTLAGNFTPDSLEIGSNIKLGNAGVITATNFKSGVTNVHNLGVTLSGGQLDVGSNIKLGSAGVVTATSFSGDGSNLTGITGTTINNNANNRVITGSGTANTLEGESKLTFDPTTTQLKITRDDDSNSGFYVFHNDGNECARLVNKGSGHEGALLLQDGGTPTVYFDGETGSRSYINTGAGLAIGTQNLVSGRADNVLHLHKASSGTADGPTIYFTNQQTGVTGSDGFTVGINDTQSPYIWNRENTDLRFGTNNAERVRITSAGAVTKPYQFKFLVETNGTSVSGGWNKLTGLSIDSNYSTGVSNGTYWSNTNQRFTAPVSGTYLFFIGGFSSTAEGGGTNHRYMYVFQVNGSGLKYGFGGNYSDNNTPMAGGAMHIPLNVNDYVEVQYYTAISATWGAGHRFFWGGYLLG